MNTIILLIDYRTTSGWLFKKGSIHQASSHDSGVINLTDPLSGGQVSFSRREYEVKERRAA